MAVHTSLVSTAAGCFTQLYETAIVQQHAHWCCRFRWKPVQGRQKSGRYPRVSSSGLTSSTTRTMETFMDISSINSTSALSQLLTSQTNNTSGAGSVATDSSEISSLASLMSQLQQLQQSDPTKFKTVIADIASTLKTDAKNATGSQASFLNNLAAKFDQAAQTGQMPDLQPKAQAGGHHHHHHHVQSYDSQNPSSAGISSATSSSSSSQTPFDLAQVIQNALQQASG